NVRSDVVMRQHYAFRLTSAAAREYDCGDVIKPGRTTSSQKPFQKGHWHNPADDRGDKLFRNPGILQKIFKENSFGRNLSLQFFNEFPRRNHRLNITLHQA